MSYKVPYLTTTWGNKKMPYGTFIMLVMTRNEMEQPIDFHENIHKEPALHAAHRH